MSESECACIYVDHENPAEEYAATIGPTGAETKCAECGRAIPAGEECEHVDAVWGRCPESIDTCSDCLSVRKALFCGSFNHHDVYEDVLEHIQRCGDFPFCWLDDVTPAARERIAGMLEDYWYDTEEDDDD